VERPTLEVADIFRDHGPAWRRASAGHISLGQMKVMKAIERCRTAALGGHVARCENGACGHTVIVYNSCRNRHCPKCQGAAAREWLAEREAELLPVPYFHVVYTLPAPISDIAYTNKAVIYDLLFRASAETTLKIAATRRHLGARIGFMSVLHTWGSALTHHPHVHMVVPGGGLSADGSKWIACRPDYFLCVEVLSALFRRMFLEMLVAAHDAGRLQFFGDHVGLADRAAFNTYIAPLRDIDWVVYAKKPFAGPEQAATLKRSLTWDRGLEMAKHKDFTVATDVQVYFCDPQSPWQRGTNENTNLLLRQYFPRGTDLSGYSQAQLDQVSLRLNQRPRKTLGFQTPASKLHASVASTV
jgi:hypothetical protein